jgi:hypothetical protein
MNQHFQPATIGIVDEIKRLIYHVLLDKPRDGQVEQAEHYSVLSTSKQVFWMISGYVPELIPNGVAMVFFAGVDDGPAWLSRDDGFVIVPGANK